MDLDFLDESHETVGQTLKRRYAQLAAWIARANRPEEPARLPEPVREVIPPRVPVPARQPMPARPR
jgi:hypothetical protein